MQSKMPTPPEEPVYEPARVDENQGDYIDLPGGATLAPNGAVIPDPCANRPEVDPDYAYTPDKEDLDLMIL